MENQTKLDKFNSELELVKYQRESKPTSMYQTYKTILFTAKYIRFDLKCSEMGWSNAAYWVAENLIVKPIDAILQGPFTSTKQIKIHLNEISKEFWVISPGQDLKIIGYFYHDKDRKAKNAKFSCAKIELVDPIIPVDQNRLENIMKEYLKQRQFYAQNLKGFYSQIPGILDECIRDWKEALKLVKNHGKQAKTT